MRNITLGLVLLMFSCTTSKKLVGDGLETIRFKEKTSYGSKLIEQDYILKVPLHGVLRKEQGYPGDDYYVEYRITYSDSSVLYIGNNTWSGSRLNYKNHYDEGINAIRRERRDDSLYFGGLQKDGRYWKENFLGSIVVGYVNVKEEEKEKYDKSVQSVRINK